MIVGRARQHCLRVCRSLSLYTSLPDSFGRRRQKCVCALTSSIEHIEFGMTPWVLVRWRLDTSTIFLGRSSIFGFAHKFQVYERMPFVRMTHEFIRMRLWIWRSAATAATRRLRPEENRDWHFFSFFFFVLFPLSVTVNSSSGSRMEHYREEWTTHHAIAATLLRW